MLNKKFKIGWLISFKKYSIKALKRPKQISLSGLISRATINQVQAMLLATLSICHRTNVGLGFNRGVREFVSIS